jgi:hypothetical protein
MTMYLRDRPEHAAARVLNEHEVTFLRGAAAAIEGGRLPSLAVAGLVVQAVRGGSDQTAVRASLRSIGQLGNALVIFFGGLPSDWERMRKAVRALDEDALDAFDDLLRGFRASRQIVDAERLWRAGVLRADWEFQKAGDRLRVRAPLKLMRPVADA